MADIVMTPEFRVSFPAVFKPKRQKGDATSEPKYGLTMLFPKGADLSKLKAAAQEVVKEKWGDKPPKNLRSPFRDQGEKEYEGYEEGAVFVSASSKQKPGLVDRQRQDIIDETEFYPGCYARATVRAFAYDNNGNKGVAFGLNNVQKLRDGDPLGGRTRAQDDFADDLPPDEGADSGSIF